MNNEALFYNILPFLILALPYLVDRFMDDVVAHYIKELLVSKASKQYVERCRKDFEARRTSYD